VSQRTIEPVGRVPQTREVTPSDPVSYYRARYYDPQGGRFINEDPTGFRAGTNFYTYVGANPLIFNDPTGLDNREERCKAIKKALENIDKDIKDALDDLARDAKQLPETCPGDDKSPRLSIRGHRNIINKLNDDKLFKLVEYIARGCSDFDPPPLPPVPVLPPVPMRSPNSSPAGQTSTATGFVVGILIFLGILAGAGNF